MCHRTKKIQGFGILKPLDYYTMNERLKSSTICVICEIKILARFLHKAKAMPMFWNWQNCVGMEIAL
jgi:hypothetical protein